MYYSARAILNNMFVNTNILTGVALWVSDNIKHTIIAFVTAVKPVQIDLLTLLYAVIIFLQVNLLLFIKKLMPILLDVLMNFKQCILILTSVLLAT